MQSNLYLLLLSLLIAIVKADETLVIQLWPYQIGDVIKLECPVIDQDGNPTDVWGKGPICGDTGEELTLLYGVDAMVRCVWIIDQPLYNFMRNVINGQAQYRCRIPLSKGNSLLHVPFAITLWGAVEDTHIHVMNHLQFVFHVVDGFFYGATAYALRDHFVMTFPGSFLAMHGPCRWFLGHSFESLKPSLATIEGLKQPDAKNEDMKEENFVKPIIPPADTPPNPIKEAGHTKLAGVKPLTLAELPTVSMLITAVPYAMMVSYIFFSCLTTFGVCVVIYLGYLKPALIKEYRKKK